MTSERTILVLGALSAIAMETSKLMAARGWSFCLVARSEEKLKVHADDLKVRGAKAVTWLIMDIDAATDGEEVLKQAETKAGEINALLLAWGTLGEQKRAEQDPAYATLLLNSNFNNQALCLLGVAKVFEVRKRGLMVAISSVAGDRGRKSNYVYGAAKGALTLFLQGLRNRLQSAGVRVITVKPGFVATPMTRGFKQGRLYVTPDVIATGIMSAIDRGRNSVYLPWFWLPIMTIIRLIPEMIFKRLSL
jgi:decaprenylphospho-beta-D-erythro-pentofuranosid-2-ulose 2-reductase